MILFIQNSSEITTAETMCPLDIIIMNILLEYGPEIDNNLLSHFFKNKCLCDDDDDNADDHERGYHDDVYRYITSCIIHM